MKSLLALLSATLLCVSATACGSAGKNASLTSRVPSNTATTTAGDYLKSDGDNDKDDGNPLFAAEHTDTFMPDFGKQASRVVEQAITALVKRYYAAAAAGDGTEACSLLYSTLAAGLDESQGQSAQDDNKTCTATLSQLFRQQRQQLAADDVATMVVIGVGVKGDLARVTVGFKTMPVGQIVVKREGGTWKMNALLYTGLS